MAHSMVLFIFVILYIATTFATEIQCHSCQNYDAVKIRKSNESLNEFIDRLFFRYHNLYRPMNKTDPSQATKVAVNILITSFGQISVRHMEYSIDIVLRQRWNEPRLQYHGHNDTHISIGYYKSKMWTPDLYFKNSKKSEFHRVTKPNYLIFLYKNGDILFSQMVSLTLACPMNLAQYPLDSQTCSIEMGSYGYTLSELNYTWYYPGDHDKNIDINGELNLNEFYRPKVDTFSCVSDYKITGGFSCLRANLIFHRRINFYLIYTFIPSTFIVGVSWLSFFIDFTIVPARITLGLLSMLTLMTQSTTTVRSLPHVSYVKAIDIWLFTCLTFVSATLIEFAIVTAVCTEDNRMSKRNKSSKKKLNSSGKGERKISHERLDLEMQKRTSFSDGVFKNPKRFRFPRKVGHQVDRAFLIGFPTAFAIFNIVFWTVYLVVPD